MGYSRQVLAYTLGLGARALLAGGLAFLALWLAVERGFYVTAVVAGGIAVLIIADIARHVASADRLLARFVDAPSADADERPSLRLAGMARLDRAIARALGRTRDETLLRQRRIDYLESLCDTVPASLIVVDGEGAIEFTNRAARSLLPTLSRLSDLGEDVARRLDHTRYGAGDMVRLKDGRVMFAMITGFAAGGEQRRLLSLQRVAGDLDAVQLRAWSDLVRVLSHEIMNSLTPICSLAESGRTLLPGQFAEMADVLAVIADRSAGLMTFVERYRQVFDVPPPDLRPASLDEIVSRAEGLMRGQMTEASVAFTATCETPQVRMEVDPVLIDQAIINLLKNAIEAVKGRPGGSVSLIARVEGGQALIDVADNGSGLLPEDAEAVFVPFFTRKPGGSGVGLPIVRQIVSAHGGGVEYHPAPDGGAVFRLTLPLAT